MSGAFLSVPPPPPPRQKDNRRRWDRPAVAPLLEPAPAPAGTDPPTDTTSMTEPTRTTDPPTDDDSVDDSAGAVDEDDGPVFHNLNATQRDVLRAACALHVHGSYPTAAAIRDELGVMRYADRDGPNLSTVRQAISDLVDEALLEKGRHPGDGRVAVYEPTPGASAMLEYQLAQWAARLGVDADDLRPDGGAA